MILSDQKLIEVVDLIRNGMKEIQKNAAAVEEALEILSAEKKPIDLQRGVIFGERHAVINTLSKTLMGVSAVLAAHFMMIEIEKLSAEQPNETIQ